MPGTWKRSITYGVGMTGSTAIDALMVIFSLVSVLGLLALGWRLMKVAPGRMQARLDREIAAREAAMTALAQAHARAPDGVTREALARNYRFHLSAVRALKPSFSAPDLLPDAQRQAA